MVVDQCQKLSFLATKSSECGRNIVLCDTTGQSNQELNNKTNKTNNGLEFLELNKNMNR